MDWTGSVSYEMIDIIDRGVHDGPFPLDPVGIEEYGVTGST